MRLPRENRRAWLAAAVLVVVAVIVVALAVYETSKPKSIPNNPNVTFAQTDTTQTSTVPAKAAPKFVWPLYGLNDQRTRDFRGPAALTPIRGGRLQLTTAWHLGGNAPVEFPPVIDGNTLYFMDDNASVNKVNAITGKREWRKQIGKLSAATPALDVRDHLMFAPVLSTVSSVINSTDGEFVAMHMTNGKIAWKFPVPSGSESSPIVWGDNVYFGDQGGTVYDLNVHTGNVIWKFQTGGAEKGGPTLQNGVLYFGNYAGQLFAVNARNGHQIWEESVDGPIYASPTLAYGRIYVGTTAGEFYSLSQSNGAIAWSIATGNYVYSSAAAADTPGLGPTVYFGSYTGNAYAVNARNGQVDWEQSLGDSISGAASIVNNVVFFSGVYKGYTKGFDMTTGNVVFTYDDGAYTATVATPRAIYLSGHYTLYELLPKK